MCQEITKWSGTFSNRLGVVKAAFCKVIPSLKSIVGTVTSKSCASKESLSGGGPGNVGGSCS